MIIVDTHAHVGHYWYEPVETLLFQMDRNKVDKAVLIQFLGNYDNSYELECVRNYPERLAAVVMVDTDNEDAPDDLEKLAKQGAVGVRLRPDAVSPGSDPLALWRKASELGMVISSIGRVEQFATDDFRKLVEELPDLKIVLEHLGGLGLERGMMVIGQNPPTNYILFEKVLDLAEYPNIYIKLPGFGELLPRPMPITGVPFDRPPDSVSMTYEAFGRERIMWGSDFPPSATREGYSNALRLPLQKTPFFNEEDKEWIFGKTALYVWKMD